MIPSSWIIEMEGFLLHFFGELRRREKNKRALRRNENLQMQREKFCECIEVQVGAA
jgi:hypothetical protein